MRRPRRPEVRPLRVQLRPEEVREVRPLRTEELRPLRVQLPPEEVRWQWRPAVRSELRVQEVRRAGATTR